MVAMHPNVQDLIVEELNEVFGKQQQRKDLIIDYGHLSQLKYVDMVIKETLRLYSPATGIFREVKADVDLGMENVFQFPLSLSLFMLRFSAFSSFIFFYFNLPFFW